jgi:hypothetical protein
MDGHSFELRGFRLWASFKPDPETGDRVPIRSCSIKRLEPDG